MLSAVDKSSSVSVELSELDDPGENGIVSFNVKEYQTKGLFSFEFSQYSVTEDAGEVVIRIIRRHGSIGKVVLEYTTVDGTATSADGDFVATSGYVLFEHNERQKSIAIQINEDDVSEAHFETFSLQIHAPGVNGADVDESSEVVGVCATTINLYDYMDGNVFASSVFSRNDTRGWSIIGNGDSVLHSDMNGIYGVDNLYGLKEYSALCDYSLIAGPCNSSCPIGSGKSHAIPSVEAKVGVLSTVDQGLVVTQKPFDFPSDEFTISFWVKITGNVSTESAIVSYVATGSNYDDIAIYNPTNLRVAINSRRKSDFRGLVTSIDVSDGRWHHVAVSWRSADGRVSAHLDGMRRFLGGPYNVGQLIHSGGYLALAKFLENPCEQTSTNEVACPFRENTHLDASIQNFKIWGRVFSIEDTKNDIAWPSKVGSESLHLYWRFNEAFIAESVVLDLSDFNSSLNNVGTIKGAKIIADTPSLNPFYPCESISENEWAFKSSSAYTGNLSKVYGGRLQFKMLPQVLVGWQGRIVAGFL